MHIRVDNGVMPPERLDDFAAFVRDALLPDVRSRRGYGWLSVWVNRTTGAVSVATGWETEEDRSAAAPAFAVVLRRAAEFGLRPVRIDLAEQVLADVGDKG